MSLIWIEQCKKTEHPWIEQVGCASMNHEVHTCLNGTVANDGGAEHVFWIPNVVKHLNKR